MKPKYISFLSACHILKKGGVVAIPTETVYGLAGSVWNLSALKKIFQIKKRPLFNPLIVHCASAEQMRSFHTVHHPLLKKMIRHFSPGPLTFILQKSNAIHPLITAGQEKVGLRIPKHPLTLRLIKTTGAVCAPSANFFSQLSPTHAKQVYNIFKGQVPVLNGGASKVGIESTVIEPDFKNKVLKILRPGGVSKNQLQNWLKKEGVKNWQVERAFSTLSPGQSKKHYQPAQPLTLIETKSSLLPLKKDVEKKLTPFFPGKIFKELKLSPSASLSARTLYHRLNKLSQNPNHVIYIIKPKNKKNRGSWPAIWNRLNKASSRKIKWQA